MKNAVQEAQDFLRMRDALPHVEKLMKDASGHEHAADGKFGSTKSNMMMQRGAKSASNHAHSLSRAAYKHGTPEAHVAAGMAHISAAMHHQVGQGDEFENHVEHHHNSAIEHFDEAGLKDTHYHKSTPGKY